MHSLCLAFLFHGTRGNNNHIDYAGGATIFTTESEWPQQGHAPRSYQKWVGIYSGSLLQGLWKKRNKKGSGCQTTVLKNIEKNVSSVFDEYLVWGGRSLGEEGVGEDLTLLKTSFLVLVQETMMFPLGILEPRQVCLLFHISIYVFLYFGVSDF